MYSTISILNSFELLCGNFVVFCVKIINQIRWKRNIFLSAQLKTTDWSK
jgi:hypothetical protein